MHVYFSGIGGSGIGPLALIAAQAGHQVSGSDATDSSYISYLKERGIKDIHIGQNADQIAKVHKAHAIDWFVYSSALPRTDPDHAELKFCEDHDIKTSRRDEFLSQIIKDEQLKLIAIAGTHGKTTTTAMAVWLFKQLKQPVSYSIGGKISFGDISHLDRRSQYFVYEADEYDRNFLSFYPELAIIAGIDYDHPDIYPTREAYQEAFQEFIGQSEVSVLWHDDAEKLGLDATQKITVLDERDPKIDTAIKLAGHVNRLDAWLVAHALQPIFNKPTSELLKYLNKFPGLARRFEALAPNLYTDYAHTPPKIRGALATAHEVGGDNVVVIYEGLHNTRQHFIKAELGNLFDDVKHLYVVPSYLAREDKKLKLLAPQDLVDLMSDQSQSHGEAAQLNAGLRTKILEHLDKGDLVLALSAGGGGSLDEWLRQEFTSAKA